MGRSSSIKTLALGAAILALSTVAGIAYAASERYDSAKDNVVKAIALLKAIDHAGQPAAEKQHREHAIKELQGALEQIDKAKVAADKAKKNKKPKQDFKGKKHKNWKGKKHD